MDLELKFRKNKDNFASPLVNSREMLYPDETSKYVTFIFVVLENKYEPRHDKTNIMGLRPA
jgi:hypothetical protein